MGTPFYSRADLQYLEHGTGPSAAEVARLWRAKRAMKGHPVPQGVDDDVDRWPALPREAAGLAARHRDARTVTDLYYPGLQDRPQGHDGRSTSSGQ